MKKLLLFLYVALNLVQHPRSNAQAPNWSWAQSASGIDNDGSYSISTDVGGNVYVTGYFQSDSITFGSITLFNAGENDIFVAKYDSSGNILWAKSAGGTSYDVSYASATDAAGNVFVTGYFRSDSITFGNTTLTNNTAPTYSDIFIVKYDAAGNVLWAKKAGGANHDIGNDICTDANGYIYVTGSFYGDCTFGSITLINLGGWDVFVAKYDSIGNVIWVKRAGGISFDKGLGISVDAIGNVYVTGNFASDTIIFGNITLVSNGSDDFFVAKYNSVGTVQWAKSAGGQYSDYGTSISTDAAGNVYLTGYFNDSITFGSITLINAEAGIGKDIFVVKYGSGGNVIWATNAGGTSDDEGNNIYTDAGGNAFVTGYFSSDSVTFGNTTLLNATGTPGDIFVVKYDSGGNALWANSVGESGTGCGISIDAVGNIYVTGYFYINCTFGSTTLISTGWSDIFVAKLSNSIIGIEENNFQETVQIYPNPVSNQITIQKKNNSAPSSIHVYDCIGNLVYENLSLSESIIDVRNLSNGVYILKYSDGKNYSLKRFVKITP